MAQGRCRRCAISQNFLAGWTSDESKRDLLYRLFPEIERSEHGSAVITKMARALAEQTSFPDLENWEDSAEKKRHALAAVKALRDYLGKADEEAVEAKEREETKKRARAAQKLAMERRHTLENLTSRLNALASEIGSQEAGYRFQDWYYDLADYFEVISRRPYVVDGRQIDGSITVDGTTYINELKFTMGQAGAPDVDIFYRRVQNKADNTMGIMVSMSGFSSVAVETASGPRNSPAAPRSFSSLSVVIGIGELRRSCKKTEKTFVADRSGVSGRRRSGRVIAERREQIPRG